MDRLSWARRAARSGAGRAVPGRGRATVLALILFGLAGLTQAGLPAVSSAGYLGATSTASTITSGTFGSATAPIQAWGFNSSDGELGLGNDSEALVPTSNVSDDQFVALDSGTFHTCGIKQNATLWCWGYNSEGEVGRGSTGAQTVPLQVGSASWASVSTGTAYTCGIQTNGTLWCWGWNFTGQLGIGGTTSQTVPVQVGSASTWTSVSTSYQHTCATRSSGGLWCWGYGNDGALGHGDTTARNTPMRLGTGTDWASVSTGGTFTCALKTTGARWCWGANGSGQFGNGTTTGSNAPVDVGGPTWTALATGIAYDNPEQAICGLQPDASLWCWGGNGVGQLGDGTTTQRTSPVKIGTSTWTSVSLGSHHTCGIRADKGLWCWGLNDVGQLGQGDFTQRSTPTRVGTGTWTDIAAGSFSTFGLLG